MIYDLTIIGGGPAGVGAGVYASRKRLKTLFLTESFNGQSVVSDGIENWIGTIKISGAELSKSLEAHLRAYAADIVDIKTGVWVKEVSKGEDSETFKITVSRNGTDESFVSKTVLISTGSVRRKLEAKGAEEFDNKGLTYCATCDGPLFDGQDVFVIGGGNAAFESAAQLAAYCKSVTILNRSDRFRADPVTVTKVLAKPNVSSVQKAQVIEVKGEKFVTGIVYKVGDSNEMVEAPTGGIFVEIGLIPNTSFVKNVVALDSFGKITVDPRTQKTSTVGIWAAGDCTDGIYHQNNIATGDAVKALEDIYAHLHSR